MLAEHGAVIIDSDVLAREVVEPGTRGLAAIVQRFGSVVLAPDGSLDRAKLGQIVFSDDEARRDLNAIVHPAVRARAAELRLQAPTDAIVVQVIPLLAETGQADDFDIIIVVDVEPAEQIRRLMRRNGLTRAEARSRIRAQAAPFERYEIADVILDNSRDVEHLRTQVDDLWRRLVANDIRGLTRSTEAVVREWPGSASPDEAD